MCSVCGVLGEKSSVCVCACVYDVCVSTKRLGILNKVFAPFSARECMRRGKRERKRRQHAERKESKSE